MDQVVDAPFLFYSVGGTGKWNKLNTMMEYLTFWLRSIVDTESHPAALVWDIDDTLIELHQTGSEIRENPLDPCIAACNAAKALGFVIIVVTARPKTVENVDFTMGTLESNKIHYDELYMMPTDEYDNVATYKHEVKQELRKSGVNIVAVLDDVYSNLVYPTPQFLKIRAQDEGSVIFVDNILYFKMPTA